MIDIGKHELVCVRRTPLLMIYSRIICRPVSALLSSVSRFFCETGKPVPVPVPVVWAVHAWVRGVGVWRVWHGTRRRGSTVVSLVWE